jgi:hypothetical protein
VGFMIASSIAIGGLQQPEKKLTPQVEPAH